MKRHIFTVSILLVAAQLFGQESRFWVGGSGKWADENHWATVSGGEPGATVPESGTSVVFDENSFSEGKNTVTVGENVKVAELKSAGADFVFSGKKGLTVKGTIDVDSKVDFGKLRGELVLSGSGKVNLPTELIADIVIEGGSWTLVSDLTTEGNITIKSGSLNTGGYKVVCSEFSASENGEKLNIEKSTIVCDKWNTGLAEDMTVKAAGSEIVLNKGVMNNFTIAEDQSYNIVRSNKSSAKSETITSETVNAPTCPGNSKFGTAKSDGTLRVTVGGTGPYTIVIRPSASGAADIYKENVTSYDFPNLKAGFYTIGYYTGPYSVGKLYDGDGTHQLGPKNVEFSVELAKAAVCYKDSIDVEVRNTTGGTAPYHYEWHESAFHDEEDDVVGYDVKIQKVPFGAELGVYVIDANNCVQTGSYFYKGKNISLSSYKDQPDPVEIVNIETVESCESGSTGSITVTAKGGNGAPYSFEEINGPESYTPSTSNVQENVKSGWYTIKVKDKEGCKSNLSESFEVEPISAPAAYQGDAVEICGCEKDNEVPLSGATVTVGTVEWSVDPGSASDIEIKAGTEKNENPVVIPRKNNATAILKMKVTNGSCEDLNLTRTIKIVPEPKPTLSGGGDQCETYTIKASDITNTSGGKFEVSCTSGDKSYIEINGMTITAKKQGTYGFKVIETKTLSDGETECPGESNEITINFYRTPQIKLTIPEDGEYCGAGSPVTVTAVDENNDSGTTWTWTPGTGNGTLSNGVYTPKESDFGSPVEFTVTATNYCTTQLSITKSEPVTLNFYPIPKPSFITDVTKHFCGPEGKIEVNVTSGNTINWIVAPELKIKSWSPADGQKATSDVAVIEFELNNDDYDSSHSIKIVETNGGGCKNNNNLTANVNFDREPSLKLDYLTDKICAGSSLDVDVTFINCVGIDVNCNVESNMKYLGSDGNVRHYRYESKEANENTYETIVMYPVVSDQSLCNSSDYDGDTLALAILGIPKPKISNDTTVCGTRVDFNGVRSFTNSSLIINPVANTKSIGHNIYEPASIPPYGNIKGSVKLSETNENCPSPAKTINITFVPEPTVTGTQNVSICKGDATCNVKVDTANCIVLGWETEGGVTTDFGDNMKCETVYNLTDADKGKDSFKLIFKYKAKTPCDESEKSFVVTVTNNNKPTATISDLNTDAVCKNDERTYVISSEMKSYQWYINDSPVSGATSNTFTKKWDTASDYTLKVVYVDNNGCSPDVDPTYPVSVNDLPVITVNEDPATFCTNNPADKSLSVTALTAINVEWSGEGSQYLSDKTSLTPKFVCPDANTYNLTVTVSDANKCVNTASVTVVNSKTPVVDAGKPIKVCYGTKEVDIEGDIDDMSSVYNHKWRGGSNDFGGTETQLEAIYKPNDADWAAGSTMLYLDVETACGTITDSVKLTFLPEMVAAVGSENPYDIASTTFIEVKITAEHEHFGQVGYYLVSPTGKKVMLYDYRKNNKGANKCPDFAMEIGKVTDLTFTTAANSGPLNICTNLNKVGGVYTGTYGVTDENGWTNLYGEDPAKGGWSVMVMDGFAGAYGTLLEASITFTDINRQGEYQTIEFDSKAISHPIADYDSTSYYVPMGLRTKCYGTCDARAIANAIGGSGVYNQFLWAEDPGFINKIGDDAIIDLCAGTFYVRVTDDNECYAETSVEVLSPEEITITEVGTHDDMLKCFGDSTISIKVNAQNWIGVAHYLWTDVATGKELSKDATVNNLYDGEFMVVVTDTNKCTAQETFIISQPSQIEVEKLEITKTCKNDGVAAFTIKENSGTPGAGLGYKLYYKNGESAPTFTEVTTGLTATDLPSSDSLIFRIEDGVGCFIDTTISTVQKTLTLETKADTIKCFGGTTSATVKVLTGVAKSFKWDDAEGQTSATATGLKVGTYIVTVQDEIGCTTTDTVTIEENKKIEPSVEYIDPLCYGYEGNVRVKASAKGGVPVSNSYSYAWLDENNSTMSTDSIFENAVPGTTYYLRVKDQYCKVEDTVEIANPAQLTVVAGNEKASECSAATGSAEVTSVTGGLAPYNYNWYALFDENTSVSDTYNATNLGVDFYVVEVTDSLGCKKADTVEIMGGGNIAFEIEMAGVTCATDPNGQAHVYNVTSNGSAATNVKIIWNNGNDVLSQADTIKTLAMGLNKFMVSADEGCRAGLVEIDNSRALRVADEKYTPLVHGDDACDGGFEIVVAGGSGEYEQILTDAAGEKVPSTLVNDTVIVATGLCAGTYNLHIDIVGGSTCPVDFPITIISNALSYDTISASNGITHVKCMGDSTGIINGNAIGGYFYDSYVYEWRSDVWGEDSVRTTASIDGLPAGSYTLKVFQYHTVGTETDTLAYEHTFVVNEPTTKFTVLADSIKVEGSHCYDAIGSISIGVNAEAFNGIPASYTFSYDGWATDYVTTTPELTNLKSGDYRMVVKDVNGCSFVDTITIEDLSNFTVDYSTNEPDCYGFGNGFIKVMADGGNGSLHYSWTKDGKAISDTTALLVGLEAATYVVTIVDDSSCVKVQEIVLGQPDTLLTNVVFDQPIVCYGDTEASFHSAPMGGNGEFSFLWTDAIKGDTLAFDSAIMNVGEGSYAIKVVDKNKCWATDTIVISYPDSLYVEMAMEKSECAGTTGYAAVKINGGVAPYVVSWTAKYGTDSIIRTDTLLPGVMVDTLKNIGPDMYYVTVADALGTGCSVVDSVEVLDDGDLKFIPTKTNDIYCINIANGGAVIPRVMNGKTFEIYSDAKIIWNAGKDTVNIGDTLKTLHYGKNIVQVISMPDGCRQYGELELDDDLALHVSVENIPVRGVETASNGALIAEVTGGYPNYTCIWQNEAGDTLQVDTTDAKASLFGLNVGRYILYVKDQNPETCEIIDTIDIKFEPLRYDTIVLNNVTCNGWNDGKIEVKGKGGLHRPYFYEWSSPMWPDSVVVNTPDIADLKAGSYMLKMWQLYSSDSVECLYDTIVITEPSNKLSIEKLLVDSIPSHCYDSIGAIVINQPAGFEKLFGGSTPFTYTFSRDSWSVELSSGNEEKVEVTGLTIGDYKLYVRDSLGCDYNTTITINDLSEFRIKNVVVEKPICYDEFGTITVTPTSKNGGFKYSWMNDTTALADTTAELLGIKAGTYIVKVTDDSLCVKFDTIEVTQPKPIIFSVSNTIENSCFNVADGEVSFANITGGWESYKQFLFVNPDDSTDVKLSVDAKVDTTIFTLSLNEENYNLISGKYNVLVKDAVGCLSDPVSLVVNSKYPQIDINSYISTADVTGPDCQVYTADGKISDNGWVKINFKQVSGTVSFKFDDRSVTEQQQPTFDKVASGNHLLTIGYTNDLVCAVTDTIKVKGKDSFAIEEAGFYQNGKNSPAIFTCADNELSAYVTASGKFSYSFYAQYIEEPVETIEVPVDTVKADSNGVAYVSRYRKLRFYADSLEQDSSATEAPVVVPEEVKKPAYSKLETINGVVYAVFTDSSATNKGWADFMPYGGETYYYVSVSNGKCMDIDSIKATAMKPVNKLNARLSDDETFKLVAGRYEVAEGALVTFEANTPEFEFGDAQSVFSENYWTWKHIGGSDYSALIPELDSIGTGTPMTAKTYGELVVQAIDTVVFTAYDDIYRIDTTLSCVFTDKLEINSIDGIKPMEVFTPNGDEYNETWRIDGLASYSNVTIYVFNRWGGRVWQYSGSGLEYSNAHEWDGRNAKNKPLPAGTYYYVIQCSDDVLVGKKVTGPVTIIR